MRPDVVVEDNVVAVPALLTGGAPYVRIMSCNPLEARGPQVAPPLSGLRFDDRALTVMAREATVSARKTGCFTFGKSGHGPPD